ncbi:hypothetical protein C0993_006606 [Termitomyces sp. T159_Od127]|nr:hypothetical protein C0993_006606 [Termitomyces sp. T159_Od127]
MAGRTAFTEDEDNFLVKYIAKYNPSTTGRSGNTLYKTLCENADNKWKWSRTHPWQSWRDRYCKNQHQFDRNIKKYQMKHDLLSTDGNTDEKNTEEQPILRHKRRRETEGEEKRARAKHDQGNQIPALETVEPTVIDQGKVEVFTTYIKDEPTLESRITQANLGVASIGVVEQKEAENVNEPSLPASATSTPSSLLYPDVREPLSSSTEPNSHNVNQKTSMVDRQRNSPITYQTSHRVVPADSVASTSKVHTISKSRRRKPAMKDDVFFESPSSAQSPLSPSNITRSKHRKPKLVEGPFGTRFASRRKSDGSVSDLPEDEKGTTAWPPPRKRNTPKGKGKVVEAANTVAGELPLDEENEPDDVPASTVGEHQHQLWKVSLSCMNGLEKGQEEMDDSPTSLQRHWGGIKHPSHRESFQEVNETPDQRCLQVSSRPSLNPDSATKSESGATGREPEPIKILPPRHSWTPNNPFQSTNETIFRRHSMGNLRGSSTVRKLDLRAEMAKRRFAASSPFIHSRGHSVASTMPYQPSPVPSHGRAKPLTSTDNAHRRHSSIPVADEDREHIEFLGLNVAIEGIAQESGYLVEQVWRVYDHYGSVRRTQEFIRLYQKNSARIQELTHEQMMENGLGALDSAGEQRTSWSPFLEHSQKRETTSTEHTSSTLETRESRLKIKPLPADLSLPSDYSPPHETRAGEYNRLVGQGRVEEAILREHRRASGSGGVFPRLKWGTPHQSSPSTGTGEEVEDEDHITLLKRSEGQADLQEEEEMMFLSACAGMTDKLRVIEQKMDPDCMLRWVAARLGEMADEFRSSTSPDMM